MPFIEPKDVIVKQLDDVRWEVRQPLRYQGLRDHYTVEVGNSTDFASVPRIFVWFLPRYGRYTRAAILHDYLWREKAANGEMEWIDADALLRRAMREDGVPFLQRWTMWAAVRWAALTKQRGTHGWWREAPRVALLTVVVLPIVAPPALLILLALPVFWVVELILWVLLKLAYIARLKVQVKPPRKDVNRPSFSWKL